MEKAKETKPGTSDAVTGAQTAARHNEATSSDTLSDLQQTQIDSASTQSETSDASDSSSAPSPDGSPDTTRGGTGDGRDSGGPM
ncbi:MAG: hypothetical protein LC747_03445 [Acidobacteria bacterium]|nr:hypothetical protein [Acidobacteriota bacterium]